MARPTKEPRIRVQLDVSYTKRQRIISWATAQEKSVNQVLNEAVEEYLQRHRVPEAED